jgi:hypothetical protein
MNLIGKIFVVAIFVLSLVFMAFSMAIYSTHKNWREAVVAPNTGMKAQLEKAKRDLDEKTAEKDTLEKNLKEELEAKRSALTTVENKLIAAQKECDELQKKQAELERDKRDAVAAMAATQASTKVSRDELERQRTQIAKTSQERDATFKQLLEKTTEFDEAANEKALLERRTGELGKDLANAERLRIKQGLNKIDETKVPPKVDAIVTSVISGGLVEISLGSDAGLQKGHVLHVYRVGAGRSDYVGRIEVVLTTPNTAACKVDPKYLLSNIQVNDRVVSKIN